MQTETEPKADIAPKRAHRHETTRATLGALSKGVDKRRVGHGLVKGYYWERGEFLEFKMSTTAHQMQYIQLKKNHEQGH